jgi:hypothetical protein
MNKYNNPKWWNNEYDSSWERTKAAFKRDWDQTKHDFGGKEPDTNQNVNNTVKQASGNEAIPPRRQPTYEDLEPAYRFGHGAKNYYGDKYSDWDNDLETTLRSDWETANPSRKQTWMQDRDAIKHAWDYDYDDDEVVTADR